MCNTNAVLCLNEALNGSEIGLLFCFFNYWVLLEGITFSHRK
jgi:hypothetical protein